jgi:hypothetical protein
MTTLRANSGACSVLDPLFLPIENRFARRPATMVCCCGNNLRLGLMIITGVLGVALLADGSTGLIILMNEGENPLWPVSMTELVLGAVSAFGFHGLYNRKPEGARLLARMNLVLTVVMLLLLVTLPLWVPVLCQGTEELALKSDHDHCDSATTGTACATVVPATEASGGRAGGITAACLWNTTSTACELNPALHAARDADRDGSCLVNFEIMEVVLCTAFIVYLIYTVWVFIGYALQFEAGEGASMCGCHHLARKRPSYTRIYLLPS